jgi:hypothetical protein
MKKTAKAHRPGISVPCLDDDMFMVLYSWMKFFEKEVPVID